MTFDLCERFVGPMSVDLFLEQFVPEVPTARPQGDFSFSKDSVSQNENDFGGPPVLVDVQRPVTNDVIDRRGPEIWIVPCPAPLEF